MDIPPFSLWRPHPWHGLEVGPRPPELVNVYVEITPFDLVKYEVDKATGYLRVDRPQRSSSQPPTMYGFIPRTYCAERVQALSPQSARGDGDPLDICVISERPAAKSEVLLHAHVVGGLQMIDGGDADDKIVAVLENDPVWGGIQEIGELPKALVERLRHYFSTYKLIPGQPNKTWIEATYPAEHAFRVVEAAIEDYRDEYGQWLPPQAP